MIGAAISINGKNIINCNIRFITINQPPLQYINNENKIMFTISNTNRDNKIISSVVIYQTTFAMSMSCICHW